MKVESNNFVSVAQIAVKDPDLQEAVALGTFNGYSKRLVAMFSEKGHEHGEAMRQQAAAMRRRAIQKLPDLLELAEKNMTANGIKVLWAETAEDVRNMVIEIAKKRNAKLVAKLNKAIDKKEKKLKLSAADLVKLKWDRLIGQASAPAEPESRPAGE